MDRSLRKFFDKPLSKTAANPHQLYRHFDQPQDNMITRSFADVRVMGQNAELRRETQFANTGPIAPLRVPLPDRFSAGGREIQLAGVDNANFVPADRCLDARGKSMPNRPAPENYGRNFHRNSNGPDPSVPVRSYETVGITRPEYNAVKKMLADKSYSGSWDAESLMPPGHRRIQNKAEALYNIRRKEERSKKCERDQHLFLASRTHPKGCAGVDTPLQRDSVLYQGQAPKVLHTRQVKEANRRTRNQRLSNQRGVDSGLLYHNIPDHIHKYKPQQSKMCESLGRNPNPNVEDTFLRIFAGCHTLSKREVAQRKSRHQTALQTRGARSPAKEAPSRV